MDRSRIVCSGFFWARALRRTARHAWGTFGNFFFDFFSDGFYAQLAPSVHANRKHSMVLRSDRG